jgi:hypothetical protein
VKLITAKRVTTRDEARNDVAALLAHAKARNS